MAAQGVIAESIISFEITWKNPGNGQQPIWDQTKQLIEIHETDVYPDLKYTAAYGAPQYVKYTSGALLNELIVEINRIIDAKMTGLKKNEAELPPGPPSPKALGPGKDTNLTGDAIQGQLAIPAGPAGPAEPKAIGKGSPGGSVVKYEPPKPLAVIDNKPESDDDSGVNSEETTTTNGSAYTVVVHGDRLRFIEGQEERGAYSAGVKFLYKVSNNLTKKVSGEPIDNKPKIWAEIKMPGAFGSSFRMNFDEFSEKEFKFGGNLLAQILPSVELSLTPEASTVYSKEKPELDLADVIKATNITLGNKSTSEIRLIQQQIQKELEAREPDKKEKAVGEQKPKDKNK